MVEIWVQNKLMIDLYWHKNAAGANDKWQQLLHLFYSLLYEATMCVQETVTVLCFL